jgi:hypothetical protein
MLSVAAWVLGPLLVISAVLAMARLALRPMTRVFLLLAGYGLAYLTNVAWNFGVIRPRGVEEWTPIGMWTSVAVTAYVAPLVYAVGVTLLLKRRATAGVSEPAQGGAIPRGEEPNVRRAMSASPVVVVAIIQAITTILAALITKLL